MKTKRGRFDIYRFFGDLANPEETGLIACDQDYDLGTPNWHRHENITLVASNTELRQCLLVHIKWRPNRDKQLVTLISRMELVLGEDQYEFEQIDTYKPSESPRRPGRITQYGSSSSKLKLYISSPYRRMRLVFNGQLRKLDKGAATQNGVTANQMNVFAKLSCVLSPVSEIYDFYEQYDEECLKQMLSSQRLPPTSNLKQTALDLLLHDRHEQKVRLTGEYLIIDKATGTRTQETFSIWGFHCRHFIDQTACSSPSIKTKRLYAHMNNGQAFHIGRRQLDSSGQIDFGYTTFHIQPAADPIDKRYKFDWPSSGGQEFELEISGQGHTFECRARRKLNSWYRVETNGKPGWAWLSLEDSLIDDQELETVAKSGAHYEQAVECGLVASQVELEAAKAALVVRIDDDSCSSSQLVGSKAASLAQLVKFAQKAKLQGGANYRVPFAFVLTKFAHDMVLSENRHLQEAIGELQQLVGRGEIENLRGHCKIVSDLVAEQAILPLKIRDELWQRLEAHYGSDRADPHDSRSSRVHFAVRSSSWGEDEEDMSAAGQLSTILNVEFNSDQLARAIMTCFASKFSYENIEYKRQHGMPLDLPMAVVVQEMISTQKAGVMFTCNPTTGDESIVTITANYGLGESVVGAQADPDTVTVHVSGPTTNEQLKIGQVVVGKKDVIIAGVSPDEAPANYDKSKCCLSDDEILQLAKCGLEVKRYFWSQRRDIEWGYREGQLYLFQSRPVTGLEAYSTHELLCEADRPLQAELIYCTRANIGEVMPSPITPFSLTSVQLAWNPCYLRMLARFDHSADQHYCSQCSPGQLFHVKYHSFFNLCCNMLLPMSDEQRTVLGRSMEISYFGREMGLQADIVESARGFCKPPNLFAGVRYDLLTLPLKLMPERIIMKEKYALDKLRSDVRSLKLAVGYESDKMSALYRQMNVVMRSLDNCFQNNCFVITLASNYNMSLSAVLSRYIKDPMQLAAATNKFLAISPDVISAEIPERVKQMAKLIGSKGESYLKQFVKMTNSEALQFLTSKAAENKQLAKQFDEFLQLFGHRCYNEFELAEWAWREQPELVVDMIKANCSGLDNGKAAFSPNSSGADSDSVGVSSRPKTTGQVIKSLNLNLTFRDKMLIRYKLAPRCQLMLSIREKAKSVLVLFHDVLREASRMLAEEMQRQLRIPDADLFYYLMFDEVEPLICDHQPAIVCQAIRRRQMFKRTFGETWKFDEIISADIVPKHLKVTRDLDKALAEAPKLLGTPASGGKVQAKVCLINGYKELDKVRPGSILLTHSTDIAFSPIFPLLSGIITEVGGLISHGAVVAREYGLPSVIGIPDVTRILQDGEEIILDADNGAIIRLNKGATIKA